MTRVNIYEYPAEHDSFGEIKFVGWFDRAKAECWGDDDGNNNGSGGRGRGQAVMRTRKHGKWIMEHWTCWQGEQDTYSYISPERARDWLLHNHFDEAVEKYFGELEEEIDLRGRPKIGPSFPVKLAAKHIAALDELAKQRKTSRSALIREAVEAYLAKV